MDYRKHYNLLIERAKNRVISGYVEVHHVLPRCMGGTDDKTNLVQLTPEEHFVAHQLLCKIHPEIRGLAFAAQAMTINSPSNKMRTNNKLFGWLRRRYAKAQKGRIKSEQERRNIAEAGRKRAPRKFSEQARENMRLARLKVWEERRKNGTHLDIAAKTKATRIKNGSYEFSEEWKKNIGESGKGRTPWNKGIHWKKGVKTKPKE